MKKVLKKICKSVIAVGLALSILFPVMGVVGSATPKTASADIVSWPKNLVVMQSRSDDNFEIEKGAAVKGPSGGGTHAEYNGLACTDCRDDGLTQLKYTIRLKNQNLRRFKTNANDKVVLQWTLYKDNGAADGSNEYFRNAAPKYSVRCVMQGSTVTWSHKVVEYDEEMPYNGLLNFTVAQDVRYDGAFYEKTEYSGAGAPVVDGYTVDAVLFGKDGPLEWKDGVMPELGIFFNVGSPFSSYFIDFEYKYSDYVKTKDNWFKEDELIYNVTSGRLTSDIRSIYQVLYNMERAGDLEGNSALMWDGCNYTILKAYEILKCEEKPVTIEYLKRIEGTPFAERAQATITLPSHQLRVYKDDIESQLGADVLSVLGSPVRAFEPIQGADGKIEMYRADYLKNIWIESRDEEGHRTHYFLDINKSYEEYYSELKGDCGLSNGMYEYMLAQLMNDYGDKLFGRQAADIYGFFGYTVIPNMPTFSSFSALWSEAFGGSKLNTGNIRMWQYVEYMKADAYNALLEEYGHSWLRRAWNDVITLGGQLEEYEATHYFFYVDDITENKVIFSESGSVAEGDNDSLIQNGTQEVIQDAANLAGVVLDGAVGAIKSVGSAQKTITDVLAIVGGVLLVGGVTVGGIFVYKKFKPTLKTAKKGKSKKKTK